MTGVAYCIEDGCRNVATGSRPEGMAGDTPVVELVCDDHGDIPLCGDSTCEGPGCRQSSIDAWYDRQEREAHDIVWSLAGLSHDRCDHD